MSAIGRAQVAQRTYEIFVFQVAQMQAHNLVFKVDDTGDKTVFNYAVRATWLENNVGEMVACFSTIMGGLSRVGARTLYDDIMKARA